MEPEFVHIGLESILREIEIAPFGAISQREEWYRVSYRFLAGPNRDKTGAWSTNDQEEAIHFLYPLCNFPALDLPAWEVWERLLTNHTAGLLSVTEGFVLPFDRMAAFFDAAIARERLYKSMGDVWFSPYCASIRLVSAEPSKITAVVPDMPSATAFCGTTDPESLTLKVRLKDEGEVEELILRHESLGEFLSLNIPPSRTTCTGNGTRELEIDVEALKHQILYVPKSVLTLERTLK